jgi:L-iditol 2-dehydrogenase
VCVDAVPSRVELVRALGADEAVTPEAAARLADSAEVVFETAGADATTKQAFALARPGGAVVQVGWPGSNVVPLDVASFLAKELDYLSVNRYANAFPTAIRWLADGRVRAEGIVTHRFELARIGEAFRFAHEHRDRVVKVLVLNE